MPQFSIHSPSEQVARHLKTELLNGVWSGLMPGGPKLASDLGVDRKTIEAALRLLEDEGLLVNQGAGKRRLIQISDRVEASVLRIAIMIGEEADLRDEVVQKIQHELEEAGHVVVFPKPYMVEMGMDVQRIAKLVRKTHAGAWLVVAGSRGVIEWFSAQPFPSFALFDRRRSLPIAAAGPDMPSACRAAARRLIELGHRRIVLLVRPRRRLPVPGASELAFLEELRAHRLPVSDYNLPGWVETVQGFQAGLESLFRITPPTAMIIDELPFLLAAQQFLARRKMLVPEDISLVCTAGDASFEWCHRSIAHMRWNDDPVVKRVVRWAANVRRGKKDLRQTLTPAVFVPGGSIGPVPR